MGMYSERIVVSFPPCGDEVDANAVPAFPFNFPWNHKPPSPSM
jgi:hypothetical protein